MTPPKIEHLMEFSVYCSGATIYVGQERAGEDGVTIAVTGKESFLIRSKERGAAVEMLPALLDTLPPGTRVVDRTLDGKVSDVVPRIRAEGPHDIAALEPIELIRPDGSIDWVLPFAGQFAKEPFCFLVRVRSGGDFRPSPAGGSSGSGGSSRGFLRKSRTRHCHCSAWFHVKAREEGTVAWLDRFDESAKSLAE